jgi:hypothetical protein
MQIEIDKPISHSPATRCAGRLDSSTLPALALGLAGYRMVSGVTGVNQGWNHAAA